MSTSESSGQPVPVTTPEPPEATSISPPEPPEEATPVSPPEPPEATPVSPPGPSEEATPVSTSEASRDATRGRAPEPVGAAAPARSASPALRGFPSRTTWVLGWVFFLFSLGFFGYAWWITRPLPDPEPPYRGPERLDARQLEEVATLVNHHFRRPDQPPLESDFLTSCSGPVYVGMRREGRLLAYQWVEGGSWQANLAKAVYQARGSIPEDLEVDQVEVALGHSFKTVDMLAIDQLAPYRGQWGLELRRGEFFLRYSPFQMITRNFGFSTSVNHFEDEVGLDALQGVHEIKARSFSTYLVLVSPGTPPQAVELFRCNSWPPEQVTPEQVDTMAAALQTWLLTRVEDDGRVDYLYLPASDREFPDGPRADLRMATWCLGRLAARDSSLVPVFRKNLAWEEARTGPGEPLLELARLQGPAPPEGERAGEGPTRGERPGRRAGPRPSDPEGVGLWLLARALAWDRLPAGPGKDRELDRLEGLLAQDRTAFRQHPDLPRALWRTQALEAVWKATGHPVLLDQAFQINDWLVEQQQRTPPEDLVGQFAGPRGPRSSLTASCACSLACAARLAHARGDSEREGTYRAALDLAFRNLWQQQFRGELDAYYVTAPEKVLGALRTNPWDNGVRADCASLALLAWLEARKEP